MVNKVGNIHQASLVKWNQCILDFIFIQGSVLSYFYIKSGNYLFGRSLILYSTACSEVSGSLMSSSHYLGPVHQWHSSAETHWWTLSTTYTETKWSWLKFYVVFGILPSPRRFLVRVWLLLRFFSLVRIMWLNFLTSFHLMSDFFDLCALKMIQYQNI